MLRQLTRLCVRYAERYIPNPYLYAVILTFITVAAALIWTPSGLLKVLDSWYDGIWNILAFAMQMALILVTGVTLADAPLVRGLLRRLASLPSRQAGAPITGFLAAAVRSGSHWGVGPGGGAAAQARLAREPPGRRRDHGISRRGRRLVAQLGLRPRGRRPGGARDRKAAARCRFRLSGRRRLHGLHGMGVGALQLDRARHRHPRQRAQHRGEGDRQDGGVRRNDLHRLQPGPGRAARDPHARIALLHGSGREGDEEGGPPGAHPAGRGA